MKTALSPANESGFDHVETRKKKKNQKGYSLSLQLGHETTTGLEG
jgi:hypothetical protein